MQSYAKNVLDCVHTFLSCRVDKKRDKMERQILDSQERAFWNVHRPPVRPLYNDLHYIIINYYQQLLLVFNTLTIKC